MIKKNVFLLIIIFFAFKSTFSKNYNYSNFKSNEKNMEFQQNDFFINPNNLTLHFFRQPKYTKSSIRCFLRHTYNNPNYAEKFLSLNFSHLSTFLSYARKNRYPVGYLESVISLFRQKLKSTQAINAFAFINFLDELPRHIKPLFNRKREELKKKNEIKTYLYNFLANNFDQLKENPDKTLENISEDIYKISNAAKKTKNNDIKIDKLQNTIMLFLETALSKLIWSPKDQQEVWLSIKQISLLLEKLYFLKILPDVESLDELYWSLITRFSYFLEIAGSELNLECYQIMKQEIKKEELLFLSLKEREQFITKKEDFLKKSIIQAEIKARAYESGIIADYI